MQRSSGFDMGFWVRIALTSVVVNVPLAFSFVVYGMHPVLAFGFSGAAGIACLAIWDRTRPQPVAQAEIRQAEAPVVPREPASLRPAVSSPVAG